MSADGLRVVVSPERVILQPATSAGVVVSVFNGGATVGEFIVEPVHIDPTWVTATPRSLSLLPDDSGEIRVEISMPADARLPAGTTVVGLRVRSVTDPRRGYVAELILDVGGSGRIEMIVEPRDLEGGSTQRTSLRLTNRGNVPTTVQLAGTDPAGQVRVGFTRGALSIAPFATEQVTVSLKATRPWFGQSRHRRVSVHALGSEPLETPMSWTQPPRIPPWLLKTAGAAISLAAVILAIILIRDPGDGQPPGTTGDGTVAQSTMPGGDGMDTTSSPGTTDVESDTTAGQEHDTTTTETTAEPGPWRGMPTRFHSDIDAALARGNSLYLFKDDEYVVFTDTTSGMAPNYPITTSENWRGMPSRFNDAFDAGMTRGNSVYFFDDSLYVRFTDISQGMDAGYPVETSGNWRGMPADFAQGIDAATEIDDRVYLFKGGSFVRFTDVAAGMDSGYPQAIATLWSGLPDRFQAGIDAIVAYKGAVYMFKGDEYVRFSARTGAMDPGYPKAIGD